MSTLLSVLGFPFRKFDSIYREALRSWWGGGGVKLDSRLEYAHIQIDSS